MSVAGGRIAAGVGANLIGQHAQDRNQDATVYVGNLDAQMTEELVWALFIQTGPVVNVYLPKDRVTSMHQGYGFVEFRSEDDADYAIKILNMIKVYGKPIRVNKASQDKKQQDIGANLFIGNLDSDVDEKLLYDTFSAFGMIIQTPKIMRDPESGASRGFGFVSYDGFEASDAAIEAMHGQYLCNRAITVGYAFKKDTKGERHGTPAERQLAEQQRTRAAAASRPHKFFATGPRQAPQPPPTEAQAANAVSGFAAGAPPPPPPPVANGGAVPPPPPAAAAAPPWAQPLAAPASMPFTAGRRQAPLRRQVRRAAEEGKGEAQVVRDFNEADGKVTQPASKDGTFYNDERPLIPKDTMSPEFKQRLKDEYLNLGGSPDRAMGANYFVWISGIIAVLALLSWVTGSI
ncbi:hypothetical protein WJX81_003280 [Elliptochloris bilobata]|uniref:Splicing factor 3B subunit 4 n=1 Tax=Elliptochloris bilobata TaxID=381761 RepID=A0AAW1RW12_9CHLO